MQKLRPGVGKGLWRTLLTSGPSRIMQWPCGIGVEREKNQWDPRVQKQLCTRGQLTIPCLLFTFCFLKTRDQTQSFIICQASLLSLSHTLALGFSFSFSCVCGLCAYVNACMCVGAHGVHMQAHVWTCVKAPCWYWESYLLTPYLVLRGRISQIQSSPVCLVSIASVLWGSTGLLCPSPRFMRVLRIWT